MKLEDEVPSVIARQRVTLLVCILLAMPFALRVEAQTLARPGWAGSGISTDLWWKHAILYQLDPARFNPAAATPLQGITQRLDYIQSLGVDALLLTPIQADSAHPQTLNPAYGTLEDLDTLIQSASRDHIRLLLDLPPETPVADLPSVARFWLNRGIAGFHVTGQSDASLDQAAALRKAMGSYLGQRIVIGDSGLSLASGAPRQPGPQLLLTPILPAPASSPAPLSAAQLRTVIDATQNTQETQDSRQEARPIPLLATDGPALPRSIGRYPDSRYDLAIAKVLATILFATRGDTLLYFGQELGATAPLPDPAAPTGTPAIEWASTPHQSTAAHTTSVDSPTLPSPAVQDADPASLLNWYRQLNALHHDNPAINSGASLAIDRDAQNVLAWIRRPQTISSISPPLVILCNLSANPVQLSLKSDIQRLHLRGSFLRTLLRSDKSSGPMDLQSIALPPYTAYIGELRY